MAALKGSNATLVQADPSSKIRSGDQDGRKRVLYDEYDLNSVALVTADTIDLGDKIPKGARVLEAKMVHPDLDGGVGARLDLGYAASAEESGGSPVEAADPDAFGDSINVEAAGSYSMHEDQPAAAGMGKRFSAAVQPQITVEAQGGTPATTGVIKCWIEYVRD